MSVNPQKKNLDGHFLTWSNFTIVQKLLKEIDVSPGFTFIILIPDKHLWTLPLGTLAYTSLGSKKCQVVVPDPTPHHGLLPMVKHCSLTTDDGID